MQQDILVSASGLCRDYGRHRAVSDISLQLRRGEVLGLLGPNGAGKTTTLRMLTGCLGPSAGRVAIGGHCMQTAPEAAKTLLGYLPEIPPLHKELTVSEFLEFCARLHGLRGATVATAVSKALSACGLNTVSRQIIGSLSKGYQQRVGLAQAIVHEPPVIILDEPTVGLDPNQMRQIRTLITHLAGNHAIILSSHILSEVQAVCDRVAIMSNGRIIFDGALQTLDQTGDGPVIYLGLRRPPALRTLAEVDGVTGVEALAGYRFRLNLAKDCDPRETLAQRAAEAGWGLFELREERRSLEEIFVELTA